MPRLQTGLLFGITCYHCEAHQFLDAFSGQSSLAAERSGATASLSTLAAAHDISIDGLSPDDPAQGEDYANIDPDGYTVDPGAAEMMLPAEKISRVSVHGEDVIPTLNQTVASMVEVMDTWNSTAFNTMDLLVGLVNKSIQELGSVGESELTGAQEAVDAQSKWVADFAYKLQLNMLTEAASVAKGVDGKANDTARAYLKRVGDVSEIVATAFETAGSKVEKLSSDANAFLQAAVALRSSKERRKEAGHREREHGIKDWFARLFGGGQDAFAEALQAITTANRSTLEVSKLAEQLNATAKEILIDDVSAQVQGCVAELNTSILMALASKPAGVLSDAVAGQVNSTFDPVRGFIQPAVDGISTAIGAVNASTFDVKDKIQDMMAIAQSMKDEVETLRDNAKNLKAATGGGGGGCGEGSGYC